MIDLICQAFYIFFVILQIVLLLYILLSWFPKGIHIRSFLLLILDPLFAPLRYFVRHSALQNSVFDITPMIALVVISYLQSLFYSFM